MLFRSYLTSLIVALVAIVICQGQEAIFNVQELQGETLQLDYYHNDFVLEYVGIHFDNPQKIQYKYQLEGYHPEWMNVGNQRSAKFNNLKAGEYTFKVMAANADGIWSEPISLDINILPPWWWSWRAKLFYFLAFAGILYGLYTMQVNRQIERVESNHLKELHAFKSRLYTNITHEFRTPLTVIQGMADQIEGQKKVKNLIQRNSVNLLSLINQLMDLTRLDSGNIQFHPIQGNIISYVKYLLESYESLAHSRKIKLHFLPQIDVFWMDFDPDVLLKIVGNLLSNAIKFTEPGGDVYLILSPKDFKEQNGNINGWLSTLHAKKEHLFLQVKDTGIGISKKDQEHIFDRFYKAELEPSKAYEGTGIGLAYAYELIRLLDGEIRVDSELGKGSIFTVGLPVSRNFPRQELIGADEDIIKVYSESTDSGQRIAGLVRNDLDTPVILIIEDNTDVREYVAHCLAINYQLVFASDGVQGERLAKDMIPDLIVSDVLMPEKDGVTLCKVLKSDVRTSHIPIVLLTAKVGVESRIAGYQAGADAYISKPFSKADLMAQIEQIIATRQKLQQRYRAGLSAISLQDKNHALALEDSFIVTLQQIILDHIDEEEFDSAELCKAVGMSSSQLYRKIKALTGKSIAVYIRSVRLARAQEMLLQTNKSITEIAYEVGFKDPAYFSRCFSEAYGESPRGVRN